MEALGVRVWNEIFLHLRPKDRLAVAMSSKVLFERLEDMLDFFLIAKQVPALFSVESDHPWCLCTDEEGNYYKEDTHFVSGDGHVVAVVKWFDNQNRIEIKRIEVPSGRVRTSTIQAVSSYTRSSIKCELSYTGNVLVISGGSEAQEGKGDKNDLYLCLMSLDSIQLVESYVLNSSVVAIRISRSELFVAVILEDSIVMVVDSSGRILWTMRLEGLLSVAFTDVDELLILTRSRRTIWNRRGSLEVSLGRPPFQEGTSLERLPCLPKHIGVRGNAVLQEDRKVVYYCPQLSFVEVVSIGTAEENYQYTTSFKASIDKIAGTLRAPPKFIEYIQSDQELVSQSPHRSVQRRSKKFVFWSYHPTITGAWWVRWDLPVTAEDNAGRHVVYNLIQGEHPEERQHPFDLWVAVKEKSVGFSRYGEWCVFVNDRLRRSGFVLSVVNLRVFLEGMQPWHTMAPL
ncbi:hypothetical protein NDN08_007192 [Rhodosorus marinus]|uniref:F-box domain-containing protein n=1 Tax=Rhodosorus marinus TaxID=101924 RepID=A0AAV8UL38_9RHOD|nr:hypothetical protein NDN08_007192 [Rhodosorus marinus]